MKSGQWLNTKSKPAGRYVNQMSPCQNLAMVSAHYATTPAHAGRLAPLWLMVVSGGLKFLSPKFLGNNYWGKIFFAWEYEIGIFEHDGADYSTLVCQARTLWCCRGDLYTLLATYLFILFERFIVSFKLCLSPFWFALPNCHVEHTGIGSQNVYC